MDHEARLAEARRKIDNDEPLDEIACARLIRANHAALAALQSIFQPPPPTPGRRVLGLGS